MHAAEHTQGDNAAREFIPLCYIELRRVAPCCSVPRHAVVSERRPHMPINKSPDEQGVWAEFREYFEKFVVRDIEKSLSAEVEVGTIILTVIGIDCLSGYYAGKPTDKDTFVEFMKEFMPRYTIHALDIYECIRNGLAHDYIVKTNSTTNRTFGFTRDAGEDHLVPTTADPNKIILNRVAFAKDFLEAQRNYFARVENEQLLWDKAMQRLRKRGFLTVLREEPVSPPPSATVPTSGSSISTQQISTGVKSPFNPTFGTPKPKS